MPPEAIGRVEAPMRRLDDAARGQRKAARKAWLDYQNDVKVSDVQLAAREGFESVEHAKRYTTLGMATDQGKLSNINGLAILSDALRQQFQQRARQPSARPYTRFRWVDWRRGSGRLFQPIRRPRCMTGTRPMVRIGNRSASGAAPMPSQRDESDA